MCSFDWYGRARAKPPGYTARPPLINMEGVFEKIERIGTDSKRRQVEGFK